jgi:hypothetical protein
MCTETTPPLAKGQMCLSKSMFIGVFALFTGVALVQGIVVAVYVTRRLAKRY